MIKNYLLALAMLFPFALSAQHEIWGTVGNGGLNGYGFIYKSDSIGDNLTVIHHFEGNDGYGPGALLEASNGKLYGVTTSGGQAGTTVEATFQGGVLFEVDPVTDEFTILKHFYIDNPEITGVMPMGHGQHSLTEVSPGIIYGNIRLGNSDSIFSYSIEDDTITSAVVLPTFTGGSMASTYGMRLTGALYLAEDGYLYGATAERSECPIANPIAGTIVRIDPETNTVTIPYMASCTPVEGGYIYKCDFVAHGDELYSVAMEGGDFMEGVIYSYNPVTDVYTKKFSFDGEEMGMEPNTLMKASNGKLYGTTVGGGLVQQNFPNGCGMLYEFDPETNEFTKKLDFLSENGWVMAVGAFPQGLMIEGPNGKLYGTTPYGIYEYDIEANTTTPKGRFPYDLGYNNGFPSLTSVCRKPVYSQTETSLLACPGESFSFDLQSPNSDSVTWYHDGIEVTSQTATVLAFENLLAADAGEWKAVLANECGTLETHILTLSATTPPVVIGGDATLTTDIAAESYQWIDCDTNLPINGADTAYYTPMGNGSFAVTVTTGSCSINSECFEYTMMGIPSFGNRKVLLYPNPAGDEITIEVHEDTEGIIYSILGQKLMEIKPGKNDISSLPAGTYFVLITDGQAILSAKFTKQ